jgi:hypothetical protein
LSCNICGTCNIIEGCGGINLEYIISEDKIQRTMKKVTDAICNGDKTIDIEYALILHDYIQQEKVKKEEGFGIQD